MNTVKKAAIATIAAIGITSGAMALTASAAVDPRNAAFPQGTYSARTVETHIEDITSSIPRYSKTGTTNSGKNFNCMNSSEKKVTTNSVTKGITSSMTAQSGYGNNYKWCSVYLEDSDEQFCSEVSFESGNPNDTTVSVTNNKAATELNGTIYNGYYLFNIYESDNTSSDYLSRVYLDVWLVGVPHN